MDERKKIKIGTMVKVISEFWGESDKQLYSGKLMDKSGIVIEHDDDMYTPPNVVEIEGVGYFLPSECLQIVEKITSDKTTE